MINFRSPEAVIQLAKRFGIKFHTDTVTNDSIWQSLSDVLYFAWVPSSQIGKYKTHVDRYYINLNEVIERLAELTKPVEYKKEGNVIRFPERI